MKDEICKTIAAVSSKKAALTKARDEIARMGEILYQRQLAHGSAGNVSVRLEDGSFLCTPTNSCLGFLDPDGLAHLSACGTHISGGKPSKESFFHQAVYQARTQAGAVVHLHSTHAVAISCLCHDNSTDVLPPLTAYHVMRIGRLPLLPYYPPGDRSLAAAVGQCASNHKAMLLANHGPIVSGSNLQDAVWSYEELEETAKISLLLEGRRTMPLSSARVAQLAELFPS
jgi:ribulose-5-phosphate 4-epimerase/fuculose-1-phosphate aldolase